MLDHRVPRRKCILIVESNPVLAHLLQATIAEKTPYGAVRVSTGEHALTVLTTVIPDLLILNTHLSDMTGADLVTHIHEVEKLKTLPLLLLGTDQDQPIDNAIGLSLPLQLEVFLQTLAYLLVV
jgi:two-component system, OmpR family, phosphate regulon response regulator PhoB